MIGKSTHLRPRTASFRGIRAAALGAACLIPSFLINDAKASLWESSEWALTGDVDGALVYDSNIFGRSDGSGDTSVSATPTLRLQRKGSLSYLRFDLSAQARRYFDFSEQDTIDPTFKATFRYPESEEALSSHQVDFVVQTRSYANLHVGERTKTNETRGEWRGTIRDTGKTQILGRLGGSYYDYRDYGTENWTGFAGLGLGWFRTELMQLSLNYDFEHENVTSTRPGSVDSDRDSHGLNVGVRGELSPKMQGSARVGVRNNKFSGAFSSSQWDWFANADITWRLHERQSFTLGASRNNSFDPNGDPYTNTSIDLSMRQGVTSTVAANLRAGWFRFTYIDFVGSSRSARADSQFNFGAALNYTPSGRFDAGASIDWYSKDSNLAIYNFSGYKISARATFRF